MTVESEPQPNPFPKPTGGPQSMPTIPRKKTSFVAAQPATSPTTAADTHFDTIAKHLMAMQGDSPDAIVDHLPPAGDKVPSDETSRASQPPPPDTATPAAHGGVDVAKLLIDIALAETRDAAIKTLVASLSKAHPEMTIRCGIGAKRMRRFYDPGLGWAGPESNLQRMLDSFWDLIHGNPQTGYPSDPQSEKTDHGASHSPPVPPSAESPLSFVSASRRDLLVPLWRPDPPSGEAPAGDAIGEVVVLWVSDSMYAANEVRRWEPWLKIVAASLWSRPAGWLPSWFLQGAKRPAVLAAVATLVTLLLFFPTRYRVSANVLVQPVSPRVISAPFEAMVEDVMVHPGDVVKAGQSLIKLDGRPLRLERQSLDAEISQSAKQKDIALAAGKVAESQQAQLKYQQLVRRRDLIDRRLEQLTVTSPISGVVVSGDLRQAIGASLELGKVLLEIAPLNRVLAEVAIPEYEISMIRPNSPARIRIDASGCPTIQRDLVEIYPAGELRDTEVVFISLLELDNRSGAYRPGMTGKATVYGEIRPFVWPYVRKAIDQLTWIIGL